MKKRNAIDIRDIKPSRIVLDFKVTIDGGTIGRSAELDRVVAAVLRAFETTSHDCGLGFAWAAQLSCVMPKRMDARVAKDRLDIVSPPAPSVAQETTTP